MSSAIAGSSKQSGGGVDSGDSYNCQRCHQPLLLDPSMHDITPSQYSLIASNLPAPAPASTLPASSKLASLPPSSQPGAKVWAEANHLVPATGSGSAGGRGVAESYILLSESALMPPPPVSKINLESEQHQRFTTPNLGPSAQRAARIATPLGTIVKYTNLAPALYGMYGPADGEFQKMAEELTKERDAYISFEQSIQRNRDRQRSSSRPESSSRANSRRSHPNKEAEHADGDNRPGLGDSDIEGTEDEWDELMRRKQELEAEEEQLKAVLRNKEEELDKVKEEEQRVKEDEEQVDREETDYLLAHSALSSHLAHLTATLSTAQTHLLLSQSLLSHLESTNVYNDAFQIGHVPLDPNSHSGITVGTINGLRLGGRPTVEWEEINAAWGLVALCLDRVADKVGCKFQTYKIVPLGSYSRVEELPPSKNVYELYASSDITPARLLQNRRFNHAMVGLLDCLRQLVEFGKRYGKWAQANIEIHKDKIGGHSIRLPGISSMPLGLPSMSIMGLGSSSSSSSNSNPNHNEGGGGRDRGDTHKSSSGGGSGADSTAEENWTRACRAVLVVLKSVLIAASSEADRGVDAGK